MPRETTLHSRALYTGAARGKGLASAQRNVWRGDLLFFFFFCSAFGPARVCRTEVRNELINAPLPRMHARARILPRAAQLRTPPSLRPRRRPGLGGRLSVPPPTRSQLSLAVPKNRRSLRRSPAEETPWTPFFFPFSPVPILPRQPRRPRNEPTAERPPHGEVDTTTEGHYTRQSWGSLGEKRKSRIAICRDGTWAQRRRGGRGARR